MRNTIKKGLLNTGFAAAAGGAAVLALPALPVALAALPLAGVGLTSAGVRIAERRWNVDGKQPQGQPLTAGEIAFAKSIFGDSLSDKDLKRLRKYLVPEKKGRPNLAGYAVGARRVDFYGSRHHEEDYSRSENPFNYGLFIHELTHTWQTQRLTPFAWQFVRNLNHKYPYTLTEKSKLTRFGYEQQAAIIEDYVRRFMLTRPLSARRMQNRPQNDALLQRVVENQFPEAKKTRLKIEAQRKKPQPRL